MQGVFKVSEASGWDMSEVAATEVRILLLYSTQAESASILESAAAVGLTSSEYLWMVTQSVVGNADHKSSSRKSLPVGMIGERLGLNRRMFSGPFHRTKVICTCNGLRITARNAKQRFRQKM